ncbi:MAG TPA: YccF domain-containing protein [Acidimicrobiia bacterium]|nr:YccF domain-containing protein [Acidimicrobiia bacterium]
MRVILNLIWLIFAGIELAVAYVIAGLILMITIVGIPFGLQAFKLAGFALWPFGRAVVRARKPGVVAALGNVLWVVLAGWWLALAHIVTGLVLCLTIIGIPMGIANFKMTSLAFAPFGRDVVSRDSLDSLPGDAVTVR